MLERLFVSHQRRESARTKTRYSGTVFPQMKLAPPLSQGPVLNSIERLSKQFYEDEMSLQEVWKNCEKLLMRDLKIKGSASRQGPMSRQATKFFEELLMAVNRSFLLGDGKDDLPPPHKIINLYGENAIMRYWWDDVLWCQLAELLNIITTLDAPQANRNATEERAVLIMTEIVDVWSTFICKHGPPAQPGIEYTKVPSFQVSNHAWFIALLPKHHSPVDDRILAACKLTHQILDEFTNIRKIAISMTDQGQVLLMFLNRLVEGRTFSISAAHKALMQEGVERNIINRWLTFPSGWGKKSIIYQDSPLPSKSAALSTQMPLVRSKLVREGLPSLASLERREMDIATAVKATGDSLKDNNGESQHKTSKHRAATTIIKDLERAVDRFDVARAAGIWQEYQRLLSAQKIESWSREEIFIHFLSSFIALSRQEQAVHVWNEMLRFGVTPNQRHWNAMLHGASRARDVNSLDEIWNGMLATGIEPDIVSWTTYINGLIMCNKDQRGLQALHHLGRIWKQTAKDRSRSRRESQDEPTTDPHSTSPKHDAGKPSLAPVQAAVGALLRIRKEELCWPLLDWAKSFSIPLTIGFFNVILRYAVRQSDADLIKRTFKWIEDNDCSPDEQTYTILLNGHMSNINSTFPNLSPQEQQTSVLRILDDMTGKNIPIDQRTYGTILYGLLNPKNEKRNDLAARAVLNHMEKNNVKPSHHIYSILASHYFSLNPPDLQAVESLWKRIKIERPILDREFYEKMVKGYAAARLVERMLYFLRRIPHEGKSPTWNCLSVVLNTLIQIGEWSLVRELITDVKDRRSGLRRFADERWQGGTAEDDFWVTVDGVKHTVQELG
ncbi:MAG: hypothetical protein LQ337_007221 [Flavoplaca oasis]|nr:MAG: hypothetical protein LQ337_007221 [Flavoplaca oasis]